MMAREAGHIPGIIGRLGDLGKKQLNIQLLLTILHSTIDFLIETFYSYYFT